MRTLFGVAVVLLACGSASAADEKYESKDGRFTVRFPNGAKVARTDQTKGVVMGGTVTAVAGGFTYSVRYVDMPEVSKQVPTAAKLDRAQESVYLDGTNKVQESKEIAVGPDKLPGRDVVFERTGKKGRARVVLSGVRMYWAAVSGPKDATASKDAAAFVGSFEPTK